jgi:hypothetical protein
MQGFTLSGKINWPTKGPVLTKFTGQLDGVSLSVTETEILLCMTVYPFANDLISS